MKIRDFLKIKGRPVITVGPEEPVAAAVRKLVENNIGALPVSDGAGNLLGIISERDLLRECLERSAALNETKVQDVMTGRVAVITPDDNLDYATSVMKQKGIRHLPVVEGDKLSGVISMRDIVNLRLEEAEAEVRYIGLIRSRGQRRVL